MDKLWYLFDAIKVGLVGALGGVCIVLLHRKHKGLLDAVAYIFVGGVSAQYLTGMFLDVATSYLDCIKKDHQLGISFIIGSSAGYIGVWAFNFVMCGGLTDIIKSRLGGKSERNSEDSGA